MAPLTYMSFLRPLPFPHISSINLLKRQTSSLPRLCKRTATLISKAQNLPPPPHATEPSARNDIAVLAPLPYHVHRTASQKLPIYHLAKRGGNLHQTRIRKIQGDVEKLRDEIVSVLVLRDDTVVINRLTGHIIIKGWYKNDIKRFLEERHF